MINKVYVVLKIHVLFEIIIIMSAIIMYFFFYVGQEHSNYLFQLNSLQITRHIIDSGSPKVDRQLLSSIITTLYQDISEADLVRIEILSFCLLTLNYT